MEKLCLIKDKYPPLSLDNIQHNSKLIDRLKMYSKNKSIDNMLLIGTQGCGKYTIAKLLLSETINKSVLNLKKKIFNIDCKGKNEEIEIIYSNFHYELNAFDFKFSDMFRIIDFIKQYTMNKNIFNNSYHIIIIRNFEIISKNVQYALRRIMEKNINTCRFILIAKSMSNIEDAILSRCLLFRIMAIKENELSKIIKTTADAENIKITKKNIDTIINLSQKNITRALCLMELTEKNLIDKIESINYHEILYEKLINILVSSNDIKDINRIRDILYTLLFDLEASLILEKVTLKILKDYEMDILTRQEILELSVHTDCSLSKGFRPIYHLEYFCVNLIHLFNEN